MAEHIFEKHEKCERSHCMICDGGLSVCTVCGCYEGSLATECPEANVYLTHGDDIYVGKVDYVGGQWVKKASVHSPTGWRNYRG